MKPCPVRSCFGVVLLLLSIGSLGAREPASLPPAMRLVPKQANLVLTIEQPQKAVELVLDLVNRPGLRGLRQVREALDSTNARRFRQLVRYFERELGQPWPQLLEQLTGEGIVVAAKVGEEPPPALMIIHGSNEELTHRFSEVLFSIIEQELARQESEEALERVRHKGVEVLRIGDEFFAATLGPALAISNSEKGIRAAIRLHQHGPRASILDRPEVQEAVAMLPERRLAWFWFDLDVLRAQQDFANLLELPSSFPPFHMLFGGLLDAIADAPYVTAAVCDEGSGPRLTIRLPQPRSDIGPIARAHAVPPDEHGIAPLLQPPGTLLSSSFYLDWHTFWREREHLFPRDQLQEVEKAEKASGAFLLGNRVGAILEYVGPRQRIVVTEPQPSPYRTRPQSPIPAFALVVEARDADALAKAVERPVRSLGFFVSFNVKMKLVEEDVAGCKLIGYEFVENDRNRSIENGLLFNFTPCFVRVGDQFIFSSDRTLAKKLVPLLQKETKAAPATVAMQTRLSWAGVSRLLRRQRDQLVTQQMLANGSTVQEAEQQVNRLLRLLQQLGGVEHSIRHEPDYYAWDLHLRWSR